MKKFSFFIVCLVTFFSLFHSAFAQSPISNVQVAQRTDGSKLVDITYDLSPVVVTMRIEVSYYENAGTTYDGKGINVWGDVGGEVTPGNNKHIIWDAGTDVPGAEFDCIVRLTTTQTPWNLIGIALASVPAGSFDMGKAGSYQTEPVHTVSLDTFDMSLTEVTQGQYVAIMGTNPSMQPGPDDQPVDLNWIEAAEFCNTLSDQSGLDRCYNESSWECDFSRNGFRLPTEAEWEYAARGGLQYEYGTDDGTLDCSKANVQPCVGAPVVVKSYPANPFRLYDICGNLSELCNDWLDFGYYAVSPEHNPTGPASGDSRANRGGNYEWSDALCNTSNREGSSPTDDNHMHTGFRIVRRQGN